MGKRALKNKKGHNVGAVKHQTVQDIASSLSVSELTGNNKTEGGKDQPQNNLSEGYALPLDTIGLIAKLLVSDNAYASCASLNVTCRAVHEETQQALWRTVLHWGVDASKAVRASTANKDRDRTQRRAPRQSVGELMLASLVRLEDADGAKYIEYLMFPGVPAGKEAVVSWFQRKAEQTTESSRMIKLKAVMILNELTPTGVIVYQTSIWRHGSADLVLLAGALHFFYEAANRGHQQRRNMSLLFVPTSRQSSSAKRAIPIKTRWSYTTERDQLLSSVELPQPEIGALMSKDDTIADAFLDVLYWVSRDDVPHRRNNRVLLYDITFEQLLSCARAIRKATSIHPALATVDWDFTIITTPVSAPLLKEMDKILAIFRGTYLRAAKEINVGRLGQTGICWSITDFAYDYWNVDPTGPPHDALVTMMYHDQPSPGAGSRVLHVDQWPTPAS